MVVGVMCFGALFAFAMLVALGIMWVKNDFRLPRYMLRYGAGLLAVFVLIGLVIGLTGDSPTGFTFSIFSIAFAMMLYGTFTSFVSQHIDPTPL